jgi:hypothetical protein
MVMVEAGALAKLAGGTLIAVYLAATPALADQVADGIALLPGPVEDVRVGGTWDREGQTGVYRIVITRSGGNDVVARLFVQWVAYHNDGNSTLTESIEIDEMGALGVDIVDYISESDADGLTVYIQADNPDPSGDQSFELFVFAPNDYMFGPASN